MSAPEDETREPPPAKAAAGTLVERPVVIRALEMSETKRVERPWERHGVMPV